MSRLTSTFINLKISKDAFCTNYTNLQSLRWRKPRWIPIAKSKVFRVPARTVIPEEEKLELRRLYNNYNTQIKSIRRYLTSAYSARSSAVADPEEQRKMFEEDFSRCAEINNKWNESQKVLRETRVAEMLEGDIEFAKRRIELELQQQERKLQQVEEIVRAEKEHSKSYITSENIDAAIEHALANPVDYNFAINVNGEKIFGRENNAPAVKEAISVNQ